MGSTTTPEHETGPQEDDRDEPLALPPTGVGARLVRIAASVLESKEKLAVVTTSWVSRATSRLLDD